MLPISSFCVGAWVLEDFQGNGWRLFSGVVARVRACIKWHCRHCDHRFGRGHEAGDICLVVVILLSLYCDCFFIGIFVGLAVICVGV
jgi:hypothetical protein